jgi:hypothetical protein
MSAWCSMIEGRRVRVVPVDDELRPVARRDATMLKIVFEDDGETLYYGTGRNKVAPWTLRAPGAPRTVGS